jgi:fructan beta-fructosidase
MFARLAGAQDQSDRVLADFESGSYGEWQVEGTAFGDRPSKAEESGRRKVTGVLGEFLASSSRDAREDLGAAGTLTSPTFTIDRKFINFHLGGDQPDGELQLIVDGKVERRQLPNTRTLLAPYTWKVENLQGKEAQIKVIDHGRPSARNDSFILLDDVILSDRAAILEKVTKEVTLSKFLNIPANRDGRGTGFQMVIDGKRVAAGSVNAATSDTPEWLVSKAVAPHEEGKTATLVFSDVPAGFPLDQVTSTAERQDKGYDTPLRPQFHFSPRNGFTNDPNGMVYHNGEYHLYFQYNYLGLLSPANQMWGHAVSRDMIHWEELPGALRGSAFSKGQSYSGSALIDRQNRAGFGANAMIAVYTDTSGQSGKRADGTNRATAAEVLAYSLDNGRTFTYYEGNPVVEHDIVGRDPKVFWWPQSDVEQKDPNGHFVMIVWAVQMQEGKQVNGMRLLVSKDLKSWEQTQFIPDFFECPEMYELPVEGEEPKWVIQGASGDYIIGDFDGRTFTQTQEGRQRTLQGPAYAGQRFTDAPDGRIVHIAWLRNHTDWTGESFSQMMGTPLEFSLRRLSDDKLHLFANPVKELEALRGEAFEAPPKTLQAGESIEIPGTGQLFDVEISATCPKGSSLIIQVGEERIQWKGRSLNDRHGIQSPTNDIKLRILVDRPLIEVIVNDGQLYVPLKRVDQGKEVSINVKAENGPVEVKSLKAFPLRSIWTKKSGS